jgi:hypothetical protein
LASSAGAATVTLEFADSHSFYTAPSEYDPNASAGTVTNEAASIDGDWGTYAQVQSDGSDLNAIMWGVREFWTLPAAATNVVFRFKGERPDPVPYQSHHIVQFYDPESLSWTTHGTAFSTEEDYTPGIYTQDIPVPSWAIGVDGSLGTDVYCFAKHTTDAWARLYETQLTYEPVPEPVSLVFFGTGLAGVLGFVARRRIGRSSR